MEDDIDTLTQRAIEVFDNHLIIGEFIGHDSDEVQISTSYSPAELLFHIQALQHCLLNDKLIPRDTHLTVVH